MQISDTRDRPGERGTAGGRPHFPAHHRAPRCNPPSRIERKSVWQSSVYVRLLKGTPQLACPLCKSHLAPAVFTLLDDVGGRGPGRVVDRAHRRDRGTGALGLSTAGDWLSTASAQECLRRRSRFLELGVVEYVRVIALERGLADPIALTEWLVTHLRGRASKRDRPLFNPRFQLKLEHLPFPCPNESMIERHSPRIHNLSLLQAMLRRLQ